MDLEVSVSDLIEIARLLKEKSEKDTDYIDRPIVVRNYKSKRINEVSSEDLKRLEEATTKIEY
jgi:hypothetical protein